MHVEALLLAGEHDGVLRPAGDEAHAIDRAAADREVARPVGSEVDADRAAGLEPDPALGGHEQRPSAQLERRRGGRLDELAVAVRRPGTGEVATDVGGERAGELLVGEAGDEDQPLVLRHRAAEQPLARLLVGQQAVLQRLGGDAGHLEPDRVDGGVLARQVVERQHGPLPEARADVLGDLAQLVDLDAIDVEGARALERREADVRGEEHAVEQPRAARRAAAALDDPLDAIGEALELHVQPRVGGVGDDRRVVGGEQLGVRRGGRGRGQRDGRGERREDDPGEHLRRLADRAGQPRAAAVQAAHHRADGDAERAGGLGVAQARDVDGRHGVAVALGQRRDRGDHLGRLRPGLGVVVPGRGVRHEPEPPLLAAPVVVDHVAQRPG